MLVGVAQGCSWVLSVLVVRKWEAWEPREAENECRERARRVYKGAGPGAGGPGPRTVARARGWPAGSWPPNTSNQRPEVMGALAKAWRGRAFAHRATCAPLGIRLIIAA